MDPFFPRVSPLFPHVEPCPRCTFRRPYPNADKYGIWVAECGACGLNGPGAMSLDAARLMWNEFALKYYPLAGEAHRLAEACAELVSKMPPDLADLFRCTQHYLRDAAINLRMRKL